MSIVHGGQPPASVLMLALLCALEACVSNPSVAPSSSASAVDREWSRVFETQLTFSSGNYDHDIDGSESDDASSRLGAVVFEGSTRSGIGGGLRVEHAKSDRSLFQDVGPPADAISAAGSLYFLYRWRPSHQFRMPVRVGPWVDGLTLQFDNSDSIEWITYGAQLGIEPEVVIADTDAFAVTLFADLALGGGSTDIDADVSGNSETFHGKARALGLEVGPRLYWRNVFASVSYLQRRVWADESDSVGGVAVRGFDGTYGGFGITIGGGF